MDRLVSGVMSAAAAGELRLPRCGSCARLQWPPDPSCRACGAEGLALSEPLDGHGTLWSFAEYHHAYGDRVGPVPYLVGIVELDVGPALIGPLTGAVWEDLRVGARVLCAMVPSIDGAAAVVGFRPVELPA